VVRGFGIRHLTLPPLSNVWQQDEISASNADRLRSKHVIAGLEGRAAGLLTRATRAEDALQSERASHESIIAALREELRRLRGDLEHSSLLTTQVTMALEAHRGGTEVLSRMVMDRADMGDAGSHFR
jgi:hypothetical protein